MDLRVLWEFVILILFLLDGGRGAHIQAGEIIVNNLNTLRKLEGVLRRGSEHFEEVILASPSPFAP